MKINLLKFILVVSLVLNISILGTAGYLFYKHSGYENTPFGKKINKELLFKELSLTSEQKKMMEEKSVPFREEINKKRHEILRKRKKLFDLIRQGNPDRESIGNSIGEINKIQEEIQRMIVMHILEEKALLDKNQQKKFLDVIEDAMAQGRQMGCPTSIEQE